MVAVNGMVTGVPFGMHGLVLGLDDAVLGVRDTNAVAVDQLSADREGRAEFCPLDFDEDDQRVLRNGVELDAQPRPSAWTVPAWSS